MMAIPTFIVEEHHEAFYVWNYAIANGLLPAEGNLLLHIDEHADMGVPHLTRSLHSLNGDLRHAWDFTYTELAIFEFIAAAVYQRMFTRLVWMAPRTLRKQSGAAFVYSHQGSGKALRLDTTPPPEPSDVRRAAHELIGAQDSLAAAQPVVLDIDLDYFSCDQAENQVERIEVTAAEYDAFHRNPYHFLRINQGNRIRIKNESGRYFLYLKQYEEKAPCALKMTEDVIRRRLDEVLAFLNRNRIQPVMIDIARSRLSGYTPRDQWEAIEQSLLEQLQTVYSLDLRKIADIAPEGATVRLPA